MKTAATYGWTVSTVDVKTAFLNAPVNESADRGVVVVDPPRIFREAQVLQQPMSYGWSTRHCMAWLHHLRIGVFIGTGASLSSAGTRRLRKRPRMTCGRFRAVVQENESGAWWGCAPPTWMTSSLLEIYRWLKESIERSERVGRSVNHLGFKRGVNQFGSWAEREGFPASSEGLFGEPLPGVR